jgi:hypothetical protein
VTTVQTAYGSPAAHNTTASVFVRTAHPQNEKSSENIYRSNAFPFFESPLLKATLISQTECDIALALFPPQNSIKDETNSTTSRHCEGSVKTGSIITWFMFPLLRM